ncbi:MAG: 7-carboxy-7-deazaguanine synthase QueE [Candidatus Omnitrophota bacterium]
MSTARITEIFYSIQGEGVFIGLPQIFIRFAGCNLTCKYCDVSRELPEREFTVRKLVQLIAALNKSVSRGSPPQSPFAHPRAREPAFCKGGLRGIRKAGLVHSVALTGGEPLLQADFLGNLLPCLKRNGFKVYLETNGTLPAELKKVGRWCDFIAVDIKLPSATGGNPLWEVHKPFLKEALAVCPVPNTFVKVVVTGETIQKDIAYAALLVQSISSNVVFIIQPAVTKTNTLNPSCRGRIHPPRGLDKHVPVWVKQGSSPYGYWCDSQKLLGFLKSARKFLPSVRLIPPIHQILNLP